MLGCGIEHPGLFKQQPDQFEGAFFSIGWREISDLFFKQPLSCRVDIGIDGEKIATIAAAGTLAKGKRDIDAADLVALPGLIDMHSHHREPGFTHKEDLVTMGRQCAAGGVSGT